MNKDMVLSLFAVSVIFFFFPKIGRSCQYFAVSVLQFLLIIIIIKLILLKIKVRIVKFQIYEWQRATVSGAFRPNPAQVRWRGIARFVYIRSKRVTASGALSFVYLKFYDSHSYF
jgi:hypothetical protein